MIPLLAQDTLLQTLPFDEKTITNITNWWGHYIRYIPISDFVIFSISFFVSSADFDCNKMFQLFKLCSTFLWIFSLIFTRVSPGFRNWPAPPCLWGHPVLLFAGPGGSNWVVPPKALRHKTENALSRPRGEQPSRMLKFGSAIAIYKGFFSARFWCANQTLKNVN